MTTHAADPETGPQSLSFARVERAIRYLERNFLDQPDLDEIARAADLSPFHFQRLFTRWAGVSPKQFVRYLTVDHAKRVLAEAHSVLDATLDSGLSGPGRLHDLFVTFEAVTPGEYKAMAAGLEIRYGVHDGPFGEFLLAVTGRGVCALSFIVDGGVEAARADLAARWPGAALVRDDAGTRAAGEAAFAARPGGPSAPIRLWCKGTNFQIKVWEALLRVPPGYVAGYRDVARAVGRPGAARAVGRALADNPIGYLIPCHRVIRATAAFETGYRWGSARKRAMLAWEAARRDAPAQGSFRPSTSNME